MKLRKALLMCGVLSSLVYVAIDWMAAVFHGGYHSFTGQTISELAARGAPTRAMAAPLFLLYEVLAGAFVVGLWMSSRGNRALRVTATLLTARLVVALPGLWFPMNLRGSGHPEGDVPHIVVMSIIVLLILPAMAFGAFALGRRFRVYSFASIATMLVFGAVVGMQSKGVALGAATPWLGVTERIEVGAFMAWVIVLAVALLRAGGSAAGARPYRRDLGMEGIT